MYVSFIKKYNAGIRKQNGSCIFQTSVEVTFLWGFFFFLETNTNLPAFSLGNDG